MRHPRVFGNYEKGSRLFDQEAGAAFDHELGGHRVDSWGIIVDTAQEGLGSRPLHDEAPLRDWKALDTFKPPDPLHTQGEDWDAIKREMDERKKRGALTQGHCGSLFDLVYGLRGFEKLMVDIATDDPRLTRLLDIVAENKMELVEKWLSIGVDTIEFHSDIGMQDRLMISQEKFRQHIMPWFKKLFLPIRETETHVLLCSDGCLTEIVDDLVECGVSRHDPQSEANTIDGIEKYYKGKMCINLDFERQRLPLHTPSSIKAMMKDAVKRLATPEGGLMVFFYAFDENTPLENIEAACEAGEECCLDYTPA
jgi:hypothetical protein